MDRGETARRIETKCVATLGIRLANARRAGYANPDRSGNRFTGQDATRAPRCGPRHLHDQPFAAGYGPSAVSLLGSAGCQPAVVGSLPTTLQRCKKSFRDERSRTFRQAAENNRLAACAPQSFDCNVDLIEVCSCFALDCR